MAGGKQATLVMDPKGEIAPCMSPPSRANVTRGDSLLLEKARTLY